MVIYFSQGSVVSYPSVRSMGICLLLICLDMTFMVFLIDDMQVFEFLYYVCVDATHTPTAMTFKG